MNKKIWERVDSQGDGRDALLIEHICLIPRSLNVRNPSHHSFSIVFSIRAKTYFDCKAHHFKQLIIVTL